MACSENYDACWRLGSAMIDTSFEGWNDWVIQWRGSPNKSLGYVAVWRNGKIVLPKTALATAYDDSVQPYVGGEPNRCTLEYGRAGRAISTYPQNEAVRHLNVLPPNDQ